MLAVVAAALFAAAGAAHGQEAPSPGEAGAFVVLEADSLVRDAEKGQIIAEGGVEARYGDRTLRAQKVIYDQTDRTIRAQGQVEIIDADGAVRYGDEVQVDEQLNAGVVQGFSARLGNGATMAANGAVREADGETRLIRVVYSACPVCTDGKDAKGPTWTLRARRAVQDPDAKMIRYEGMALQFGPAPVLYLPYFSHPDPSAGRRSGLLTPDLGSSDRLGIFYQQPYYWAISPSQDLTASVQAHGKVNPLLGLEYRKRFWSGSVSLVGSVTDEQDFDGEGEGFGDRSVRGHLYGAGDFQISDYWRWGFGVERASDDTYLFRYDIGQTAQDRGPFVGTASRLLSQLNLTGQDANSFARLSAVGFQGVLFPQRDADLPWVLPYGEYERVLREPALDGQVRLKASTYNLIRRNTVTTAGRERTNEALSSRVTGQAQWSRPTSFGPGFLASPFAIARADYYRTSIDGRAVDATRALGVGGVEASWPFIRPSPGATVMVEPVLLAAWATDPGENRDIANEDSQAFELDESNLFRLEGAPNYDLWERGGRLSVGLRAKAQLDGNRSASLMFGRRWRTEETPTLRGATNADEKTSDWVGAANLDFGAPLRSGLRFRLDDDELSLSRIDATLASSIGRFGGFARYFRVDETLSANAPRQEVYGDVTLRVRGGWHVGYGLRRDLDLAKNLYQEARVQYTDQCTFLSLAYRQTETTVGRLGPQRGFEIRLGLTTLGMFGGGAQDMNQGRR